MTELDPKSWTAILALLGELQERLGVRRTRSDPQTRFVADLGLESLEIVVLSTMIQQQYGKLPFPAFFDEIGQRPVEDRDVTVAERRGIRLRAPSSRFLRRCEMPAGPTLLIGLDGATFTVLDPYMEDGVMPFLGALMRRGHARACCARSCRR